MSEYSIRSIGIELGERELSVAELASAHGVGEPFIEASLGGMVVYSTSRSQSALAQAAVERCLAKVEVDVAEVDLLISCRGRVPEIAEPPVEVLLGRPKFGAIRMTGGCPVLFRAIWMARAWLRSEGGRRALVVYSECCDGNQRILGPAVASSSLRDILSDAAGAVLVEQGAGLALRGYGNVENAEWWRYFHKHQVGAAGQEMQIVRESMEASQRALKLSLEMAGFTIGSLDAVILPNEADVLMRFIARHLHVPRDRVVRTPRAPSHAWAVDTIHSLEHLVTSRTLAPGTRIACLSRGIGSAAALALEVVAQ
jgi:3-oxoacyl-[acyl-carrier-protein] synthase III